jgi:hypothetical protein
MKKIIFIFLIVVGLSVFNITQASAGCTIVWTGDFNGSVSTQETSRTQQAAIEAYNAIQWGSTIYTWGNVSPAYSSSTGCYGWSLLGMRGVHETEDVCTDGHWEHGALDATCSYDGSWCYYKSGQWDVVCTPTLIQLSFFTITPKAGKVVLQWNTESETDNAGFNFYRSEAENGQYTKINSSLIPAQGSSTQGASYEYIDNDVQNRKTYYYKLEDIDLKGISTMHGPVKATPRLIYGVGK